MIDPTSAPIEIGDNERTALSKLRDLVADGIESQDEKEIQNAIYAIARENGIEPKEFFPVLYRVLIGKEKGPRLGGFLKTLGGERLLAILNRY